MRISQYILLKKWIIEQGYSHEIAWADNVGEPNNAIEFAYEYIWVVLNSGMKNQVAQIIWGRVKPAIEGGQSAFSVFKHPGKAAAIDKVWAEKEKFFSEFQDASDKIEFCLSLPWIGPITKWHLAKNFGADVVKPDRHLVRIAKRYETTPLAMCQKISESTGDRLGTVDLVIWRAANLGII